MSRLFLLINLFSLLTSCSLGGAPVPADHFYRLPEMVVSSQPEPFIDTLVIKPVKASGLYHERAMLFIEKSRPLEIQRHHYHFWLKPPADLIHTALFQGLKSSGIADNVQRESSAHKQQIVIASRINRIERVLDGQQVKVVLVLDVTVKRNGLSSAQWSKLYQANEQVPGNKIHASAEAYGRALQRLIEQLIDDLVEQS